MFMRKRKERQRAKEEAAKALKEFLETPDDIVTMKMAIQAIKHVSRLLIDD
jgi:hypothetical protein